MRSLGLVFLAFVAAAMVPHTAAWGTELNDNNFHKMVAVDEGIYFVAFKAEWCGHCKALAPEWDKFAKAVSPFVKVLAIDADKNRDAASRYEIKGFPTIKYFVGKDGRAQDYQGPRTAQGLTDFAMTLLQKTVKTRLSGGGGSSSSKSSKSSKGSSGSGESAVVELTDSNFKEQVLDSDDLWLVEFFAPWCGHCQRLEPEWKEAAGQLQGEVKLGAVDATVHSSLASQYQVQGYPTIKVFRGKQVTDYNGGRTASDIVAFAQEEVAKGGGGDFVPQLVEEKQFDKKCKAGTGLCILAFLPHILDDQAEGRNQKLEMLNQVAKKARGRPYKFLWVEGGEQSELEEKLNLGFGYPAVVALSGAKGRFATMTSAFDAGNLNSFLDSVLAGKARYSAISSIPKIRKSTPWDGKDAAPPQE